jgi:VWFA-related protein
MDRLGGSILLAAAGSLLSAAAIQQRNDYQRFVGQTDVVVVDVSVLDGNRQPIRELTSSDFTILENGRPQKVEYFRHIELREPPPERAAWMRDVAPDLARNEEISERRLVVILMDDAMVPFDPQMVSSARAIARDVVDRLGSHDLAAVTFTRDNRAAQNFTRDRRRLTAAIDAFESAGYVPMPKGLPTDLGVAAVQALFATTSILSTVPERRKTIVYVTTGMPLIIDISRAA